VLGALEQVTDASLAYLSLEELLAELLDRIRGILDADTAAVLLLDADRGVLLARAAKGIEEEVRQGVQVPLGSGFAGRIAAESRPIAIEDLDEADVVNPLLRTRGIRSLLGVPLLVEGRVIGVLHVGTFQRRVFGEGDVRLLRLVADRVAIAIHTAQLSELVAATELMQRTLLPEELPRLPGLRMRAIYRPAGSGVKIGGDWYDVFVLPDGRIAFVIGDVVGRGIVAASVVAEIRAALRAYAIERHGLVAVMSLLNELMLAMGRNRSATAAMLALDLDSGELAGVSAGHLPSLVRHADGRTEFVVAASGPPLGSYAGCRYKEQVIAFPAGSALLLYTDGLVERRRELIDDGLQRLAVAMAEACESPSFLPLADRVFGRVAGGPGEDDDVALLTVESLVE
jgi:Stage II sporulation protein E (SpoIIE)/GAF domain